MPQFQVSSQRNFNQIEKIIIQDDFIKALAELKWHDFEKSKPVGPSLVRARYKIDENLCQDDYGSIMNKRCRDTFLNVEVFQIFFVHSVHHRIISGMDQRHRICEWS